MQKRKYLTAVGTALLTLSTVYAFEASKTSPAVNYKASPQMTIDPSLLNAQDPKTKEINSLKQEIAELKKTLRQTQASIGVPIKDAAMRGIPAVPANVVTNNVPAYKTNTKNQRATVAQNNTISVTPGINQIVTIAIGHTNRIVTPFSRPEVNSTSLTGSDDVLIKDNVVYVTSSKSAPISLFITDKGNENLAISLTLLPRKIPSREVKLLLNTANVELTYGSKEAEIWEKSQPFVSGISATLQEIALQRIPNGYQLSDIPRNYKLPVCSAEGFNVDFAQGQLLAGSKLHYIIGKVTNVSAHPLEFKESSCGGYDIAAVALWPENILNPGQSSEIYIVRHTTGKVQVKRQRRSVLDR